MNHMKAINIIQDPRRVDKNLDACTLILLLRLIVVVVKSETAKKR